MNEKWTCQAFAWTSRASARQPSSVRGSTSRRADCSWASSRGTACPGTCFPVGTPRDPGPTRPSASPRRS